MKFKDIIFEWLITENKEEIYKKYYSDIDRDTFIRIIKGDPKTVVTGNTIDFIGKHAKLLLNLYKSNTLKIEDLPKANEYLTLVYHHNMPVDYKKIQSIPDLYNLVKDKIAKVSTSLVELIKLLGKEEYEVKHNGDSWFIVRPLTEKAAAYLGVNTEWCTTWGQYCLNPDYKDRTNHFMSYSPQGPLYIIVNKENESDKYQLHFPSNQLKNPADSEVSNRPKFFNERMEIKKYFFPIIYLANPDIDQIKEQLPKVKKFLDKNDTAVLMDAFMKHYGAENPLISALSNEDEYKFGEFVSSEYPFSFRSGILEFEVRTLPKNVDEYSDYIKNLRYSANEAYNSIADGEYYEIKNNGEEILNGYLNRYYDLNKTKLINDFGRLCESYDTFIEFIRNADFFENEAILEGYVDEYSSATGAAAENAYNDEANSYEEILEIDGYTYREIKMPIEKVAEFIAEKEITRIDDLSEFMDGYLDFYDLPTESYFELPEHEYVYPSQEFMDKLFDDFFDDKHETLLGSANPECAENTKKFYDIFTKHFNTSSEFENEFVKITIKSPWFKSYSCDNGIALTYLNKKTNEKYEGNMELESLINHMNIEPLFENISFKSILKEMKKGD